MSENKNPYEPETAEFMAFHNYHSYLKSAETFRQASYKALLTAAEHEKRAEHWRQALEKLIVKI